MPAAVTSIHGSLYPLGPKLGRGGQGAVYAVQGANRAVKIYDISSPQASERLRDQLALVGRLPLENLAVSRPIEQLRAPHVGYVMELFTGMVPIHSLQHPPKGAAGIAEWYLSGGGLQRRLRLLARTAEVMSALHGRGLVYVDPSPHNIFVSEHAGAYEVRLIDMDNLRPASAAIRTLYTPGYGAPEIVRQTGVPSSLSDAYAFAVIAFETLALVHPLLGDAVRDGEPEWEEQALQGYSPWANDGRTRLPWIEDADDDSNRSSDGIPRAIVLSPKLKQDFSHSFGTGLSDPAARPGLARWAERLHKAADHTLICHRCSGSFYFNCRTCPWCDALRMPFIAVTVYLWDPERLHRCGGHVEAKPGIVRKPDGKKRRKIDRLVFSMGQTIDLTERTTHGKPHSTPTVRIETSTGRMAFSPLNDDHWLLIHKTSGRHKRLTRRRPERLRAEELADWELRTGYEDQIHRLLGFEIMPGSA